MKRMILIRQKLTALSISILLAAGSIVGCEEQATVQGQDGHKLTLVEPAAVNLTQGAMNEVKITIKRSDIKDPVAIRFDKLPAGVSAVDADKKIVGDEGAYVLKADESAALVVKHHALVTATGPDGIAVSQPLVITIKEKTAQKP